MYPRFKMLIFRYKTRFFNEIFDPPRVLLGAEHESAVIFCPRARECGQKKVTKRYPIRGKNPLYGVLILYGVPSRGQNQKIPSDSSSPCQKTPQHKKSRKMERF